MPCFVTHLFSSQSILWVQISLVVCFTFLKVFDRLNMWPWAIKLTLHMLFITLDIFCCELLMRAFATWVYWDTNMWFYTIHVWQLSLFHMSLLLIPSTFLLFIFMIFIYEIILDIYMYSSTGTAIRLYNILDICLYKL